MEKYNESFDETEDYRDNNYPIEEYDTEDNNEDLEDKWYEIEDEYRNTYMNITDEDVEVDPGHFDRTMDRISRRRGKTRDEIRDEIENW
jgi:hypothetical protein